MSDPKQAQALLEAAERDVSALRGMGDAEALDRDRALGLVEPLLEEVRTQSKEAAGAARPPTRN